MRRKPKFQRGDKVLVTGIVKIAFEDGVVMVEVIGENERESKCLVFKPWQVRPLPAKREVDPRKGE